MPTIFSEEGFRFFFYSKDLGERPHVHVESTDGEAKIWLDSFTIAKIFGDMEKRNLRKIIQIARRRHDEIMMAWDEMIRRGGNI